MDEHTQNSSDWDHLYTGDERDYEPPDGRVLEIAAGLPAGRALDLGCGAGGLLAALGERGWELTGIDVTAKAIEAARRVLASRGLQAQLDVADATTWEPPGQYDLVTNTFAFPATRSEQQALYRTAIRALAPGGTLLFIDFDPSMAKQHEHFAAYHLPTVDEMLEGFAGLDVIQAEVVATPVHEHAITHGHARRHEHWTASFVHARRPAAVAGV